MTRQPSIRFNAEMARATWLGNKTATSRVIKGMPGDARCVTILHGADGLVSVNGNNFTAIHCKYRVGQRLLVKEPWAFSMKTGDLTFDFSDLIEIPDNSPGMPLSFARQAIIPTSITVRRLDDIDEAGALAEGFINSSAAYPNLARKPVVIVTARHNYLDAMRQIYKLRPDENPWVWQIDYETERIERA